eukprot:UN25260
MNVRSAIANALYDKTLKMTPTARQKHTAGQIMNLVTTDCQKLRDFIPYWWMLLSAPFQAIVCFVLLYKELGYAVFIGMGGTILLVIPPNIYFVRRIRMAQKERQVQKDKRLNLMQEVLDSIKILKLYAWEYSWQDKVKHLRELEVAQLKQVIIWGSLNLLSWITVPILVAVATLVAYVLLDGNLTPSKALRRWCYLP